MVRETFRCDRPSLLPISVWVGTYTTGKTLAFRATLSPDGEAAVEMVG